MIGREKEKNEKNNVCELIPLFRFVIRSKTIEYKLVKIYITFCNT